MKDLIKSARITKGYTQAQLAKLCGVSRQAVYYWESGKREPSTAVMFRLIKILDIDLAKLIEYLQSSNYKDIDTFYKTLLNSGETIPVDDSIKQGLLYYSLSEGPDEEIIYGPEKTKGILKFHINMLSNKGYKLKHSILGNVIIAPSGKTYKISNVNLNNIKEIVTSKYFDLIKTYAQPTDEE